MEGDGGRGRRRGWPPVCLSSPVITENLHLGLDVCGASSQTVASQLGYRRVHWQPGGEPVWRTTFYEPTTTSA